MWEESIKKIMQKIVFVSELSLPENVKEIIKATGIEKLFPPQEDAIKAGLLDSDRNFVIATPTSSGKTLLAEMVIVKSALDGYKAIYSVPLKALANERLEDFSKWMELGLRPTITTGDYDITPSMLGKADIIITTNERLDSLIRHRPEWMNDVKVMVFDEVHLIGVPRRGAVLEGVITLARKEYNPRILALSATITNAEEVAGWLDATLVKSDWRPVKLMEGIIDLDGMQKIYMDGKVEPLLDKEFYGTLDVLKEGGQVIVFQPSRKSAVSFAKKIAEHVSAYLSSEERRELQKFAKRIDTDSTTGKELASIIPKGAAFHTAALGPESRKIVERLFLARKLKVISATPTLAAGVNLPARTVIIASMFRYEYGRSVPIPRMEYKQMAGRAGRPRFDKIGYAFLVARSKRHVEMAMEYISSEPEPLRSQFDDLDTFRAFILGTLSIGKNTITELRDIMNGTFYVHQMGSFTLDYLFPLALNDLIAWKMIRKSGDKITLTRLGRIVSMLYLAPHSAHYIASTLPDAKTVEDYLVIIGACGEIEYHGSSRAIKKARDLEDHIYITDYEDNALVIAYALKMWIDERTTGEIEAVLDVTPGDLHRIVETAKWLCHSITRISRELDLDDTVPRTLELRIQHGVKEELLPLVKISGIGRARARVLYSAGIRSPEDIVTHGIQKIATLRGFSTKLASKIVSAARELLGL